MGYAKQEQMADDERAEAAMTILIDTGVYRHCRLHEDEVFHNHGDIDTAYDIGRKLFLMRKLDPSFTHVDQVKAAIDRAIENNPADSCTLCERDEDRERSGRD